MSWSSSLVRLHGGILFLSIFPGARSEGFEDRRERRERFEDRLDCDGLQSTVGVATGLKVSTDRDGKPRFRKWTPNRFRSEESSRGAPPVRETDPPAPLAHLEAPTFVRGRQGGRSLRAGAVV
jgi:hypothetical protein